MAQRNWQLTQGVQNHIVGIYHGEQSGHVVVHCNNRVIIIDFNVLQSKTYKFFIDHELYALEIDKMQDSFKYDLTIDYEADTYWNREREASKKSDRMAYMASVGLGVVFLIGLMTYVYLRNR